MPAEEERLQYANHITRGDHSHDWRRWGPYLSERQWGTVREDYSAQRNAWYYFPHDQARSRAYRWGEDGLLGICDRQCRLCFALALWNGRDPILKERLFGLGGPEGNHGEDVKECYYYLDSTPTHSYMKALYKYPQSEFPYSQLVEVNRNRGKKDTEFELIDTGIFDNHKYFDVTAEYAKAAPEDILIRITIANRSSEPADIHLLPTIWFRNTWSWGETSKSADPQITQQPDGSLLINHPELKPYRFVTDTSANPPAIETLFTNNDTNMSRLFHVSDHAGPFKDAFHDYVIEGLTSAVSATPSGTKAAPYYKIEIPPAGQVTVRLRLTKLDQIDDQPFGDNFEKIFSQRIAEADEFYQTRLPGKETKEARKTVRQAYAGLLWSKQFYHYIVKQWLSGDPGQPPPPPFDSSTRNTDWPHLFNRDVISMPDKWEYPWYAAWDLAFHMIPMATIDPGFAKSQLLLMLREWYLHPNGQIPAYEFNFSDTNPPVHAWACWRVYKMTGRRGERDLDFLARAFQKLLINFTWWVNRKDPSGKHLFSAGFLGLDNIGLFDRSRALPSGNSLEQADGTAWMAFYCSTMLSIALELAKYRPTYEDVASKFFEHFVAIADAMNCFGGCGLWDDQDGFYYDQLLADHQIYRIKVRSIVGVIPLFAVEILEKEQLDRLPEFSARMNWFLTHRRDLNENISYMVSKNGDGLRMLAIPTRERLEKVLRYVLDENEFLSPHGVRALSRYHDEHPYSCSMVTDGEQVKYVPGESDSGMFGGNSNWRGPIWFPINYLLIEALERYHHFYGDEFKVECPTGSGKRMTLQEVARELSRRLGTLFLPDGSGRRPCHGDDLRYADDPYWKDLVLFYEYFHGDTGRGLGASHQTGWTALVTRLMTDASLRP